MSTSDEGTAELRRIMTELPDAIDIKKIRRAAYLAVKPIPSIAPIGETGDLRASYRVTYDPERGVVCSHESDHAKFVEKKTPLVNIPAVESAATDAALMHIVQAIYKVVG